MKRVCWTDLLPSATGIYQFPQRRMLPHFEPQLRALAQCAGRRIRTLQLRLAAFQRKCLPPVQVDRPLKDVQYISLFQAEGSTGVRRID